MLEYQKGAVDFVGTNRGVAALSDTFIQLPLFSQAMVVAYNLQNLTASDPLLVLDRQTLADIWAGDIVMWNDARIQATNPPEVAAKLPAAPIVLGYSINNDFSLQKVFLVAMSTFSKRFSAELEAAGGSFTLMPPARANRSFNAGTRSGDRVVWMQAHENSMTFVRHIDCTTSNMPWINLINRAGRVVTPSVLSVQAAMNQFAANISEGDLYIDLVDAPGNDSWPLPYLTLMCFNRSLPASSCSNAAELIRFLAWTLTNDEASKLVIAQAGVPIDVSLRKNVIDQFEKVECAGVALSSTEYLLGTGPPLSIYTAWAVAFSTAEASFKYFASSSPQAKRQLATFDEQFGTTSTGLEPEWYQIIPDAAMLPAIFYAIVPGYNVRELAGLELVLDFETIAAIYLGEITMWNDERIRALNGDEVATRLPAQAIRVVNLSVPSAITLLATAALSATVPAFDARIGTTLQADLPVSPADNRSHAAVVVDAQADLPAALVATNYSFAFVNRNDILLAPALRAASLALRTGDAAAATVVRPNATSLQVAVDAYFADAAARGAEPAYGGIVLHGADRGGWPLATFGSFIYLNRRMEDCNKARLLASFFYWSQTSAESLEIAQRQGFVLASSQPGLRKRLLEQMANFTCNGAPVSDLYGCIHEGRLCSDAGACMANACVCVAGRAGRYCEHAADSAQASSGSNLALIISLAVAIPVTVLACCVALAALITAGLREGRVNDDWEIDYNELEIGNLLGVGGFGQVHKAMWKGTEVAVKVIAADKVTKDMEKSFKAEVRVMTTLRHPNVVLFMAASTKSPRMCIVMEFMALGSLYDLLHNELIVELPFTMKAKMAYQASKGMHFLHSSGIVHRDLKSLNLLLDSKWNLKVSDFGLTQFKTSNHSSSRKTSSNHGNAGNGGGGGCFRIVGSIQWMAPEVLDESPDVDYAKADVYAFGIILWELLTRDQPYPGLSPPGVAVAVLRDGRRPPLPADTTGLCPDDFVGLITSAWDVDPAVRPTFLEIMTRLSAMHVDSASAGGGVTKSTLSSPPLSSGGRRRVMRPAGAGVAVAPEGDSVTIVFADVTRAASLWEHDAEAMRDATLLHNAILREALGRHHGYEVVQQQQQQQKRQEDKCVNTDEVDDGADIDEAGGGEGAFCLAFGHVVDALAWCSDVQLALLQAPWPEALLQHPAAAVDWGLDDRVVFRGLRVRMGVHVGSAKTARHPLTQRVSYAGPVVDMAARITALAHGGQVVLTQAAHVRLLAAAVASDAADVATAHSTIAVATVSTPAEQKQAGARTLAQELRRDVVCLGKVSLRHSTAQLYEFKVAGLKGRFFHGVVPVAASLHGSDDALDGHHRGRIVSCDEAESQDEGDQSLGSAGSQLCMEDAVLASANLCRWVIDHREVKLGAQVGLGSYGVVYRGRWKGVEVAVKRFLQQRLTERCLLEFRAEVALLAALHHPNIVLFIGACVRRPHLCIVTEFVRRGSLHGVLADNTVRLSWHRRLRLLLSAALGLNYLHALRPVIVHRDVKPSNLLVDENWNCKVADFGFARIKEENNITMTRCGTPCWTAPEVIRGEQYDERADLYSFGIVLWQVVTRRTQPVFVGGNGNGAAVVVDSRDFVGVTLAVLDGARPPVPADCPEPLARLMRKCWHARPEKRPSMARVVAFLHQQLGSAAAEQVDAV